MRKAMYEAEVGDDVFGEDPTVLRLEMLAAERFGKEGALLVPTGTMGNQLALLTHTNRGEEIVVEAEAHIYFYEVGGIAALAGVQTRTIRGQRGVLDPENIRGAIRTRDIHFPRTSLICVENTHNRAGGAVVCLDEMEAIAQVAKEFGIPIHLDGARIFNAAIALGVGVKELTKDADTVMFSLSKGLGAPVGSMLVGHGEWIERARKWRKMLGGGMRQAGIIAAAGIVALEEMVDRLEEDHRLARELAVGLAEIKGIGLNLDSVQTNIVVMDIEDTGLSVSAFLARLKEEGVLAVAFGEYAVRMVTHKDVDGDDIEQALLAVKKVAGQG
ncbi:MAG: aminotransferase class I/II-fold pyridoxal phosphate-dependent enzyme [Clostridia bacterium]|nr:aminotransferase class I/II-fold pyridoxal phosphate-dependent enzyme [Clostridia bacterium]